MPRLRRRLWLPIPPLLLLLLVLVVVVLLLLVVVVVPLLLRLLLLVLLHAQADEGLDAAACSGTSCPGCRTHSPSSRRSCSMCTARPTP